MRNEGKNQFKYCMQQAFQNGAYILISDSVIQTFLLECGVTEKSTSLYMSVIQIVQMLTMLLLSGRMENMKNVIRSYLGSILCQIPVFGAILYVSCRGELSVDRKYVILLVFSVVTNVFRGIYLVLVYKLPYHIMNMEDYGRITGITGMVTGITSLAFSGMLAYFVNDYPYFSVMAVFSGMGGILLLASAGIVKSFHPLVFEESVAEMKQKEDIFHYRPFYLLLLPNIFRGISTGIFALTTVVGYSQGILDAASASVMAVEAYAAMFVGSLLYTFLARWRKDGLLMLLAGLGFCVSVAVMMLWPSATGFLMMYFIANFLNNIISYAVPVMVARSIEYSYIGQYTAWRMAVHAMGTALGSAAVAFLLELGGGFCTMGICGVLMLGCVVGYYLFERRSYGN